MTNRQNEKWAFIINPTAGNYFAEQYKSVIEKEAQLRNIDFKIVFTEYKQHATKISDDLYADGYKYIVAVGGDGTINEVATSLYTKDDAILGIIPAGTGNDTIQIMGFPNRFSSKEWEYFFEKNIALMDVGFCNGKIFLNGMGIGFDAQVAAENYTEDGEVKKKGGDKYLYHILKNLFFYKESTFRFSGDLEKYNGTYFMTTYANGRRFAGKYFITPEASCDDGKLDICLVSKVNLFQRFKLFMQVPKGTHIWDRKVSYFKIDNVHIEFDNRMAYHLDGELQFDNIFNINVLPKKLKVIYNKNGNHFFNG